MQTIEVAGISAGLGAMHMVKQIRRVDEGINNPKMKAMQQKMKAASAVGADPKAALKNELKVKG